ncbi:uncharacterized protein MICPUCDRAFT_50593 [Micromonas pusilla CCMP1545]|jgi:TPR repeat protein|uniref:Predicted protein n=1 Tax=Micromonas pusilla (strain CCMP1545) TaxID=564608 RepID=C1MIJ7_MICPC|nr:uncharacterized protein MICPUCDRAFT_50593 [Micromonas pusilla CCMP1545]EEH60394.1 predicted protein [Micromonas pusilla CCMP1545]|tara:strand:+ start:461 stop:1282 length:822 start_codon:yes stop_codon:yes gene_type:complete|eukprot:XP_003055142.1 predicted protein [Micromonas pusilla CCMP1545]
MKTRAASIRDRVGPFDDISEDLACLVLARVDDVKSRYALAATSKVWKDASTREESLPPADVMIGFARECEGAEETVEWLKKATAKCSPEATYRLGMVYLHGESFPDGFYKKYSNPLVGFELVRASAEAGFERAVHHVGVCYLWGIGVEEDKWMATQWFLKLGTALQGKGVYELGTLLLRGEGGFTKNHQLGWRLYKEAAKLGCADAACELGICYWYGSYYQVNRTKAEEYLLFAAKNGSCEAALVAEELGLCDGDVMAQCEAALKASTAWGKL